MLFREASQPGVGQGRCMRYVVHGTRVALAKVDGLCGVASAARTRCNQACDPAAVQNVPVCDIGLS